MLQAILIVVPIVCAVFALLVFAVRRHLDGPSHPARNTGETAAQGDVPGALLIAGSHRVDTGSHDSDGGDGGGGGD